MMLDNNAVRQNNPYLNWILNPANAPDPAPASFYNQITGQDATFGTIPFNAVNNVAQSIHPTYAPQVIPGVNGGNPVNAVTYGPQLAIYDFTHGAGTYTPVQGPFTGVSLSYFNPFQPWGRRNRHQRAAVCIECFRQSRRRRRRHSCVHGLQRGLAECGESHDRQRNRQL
jgi:hypothetical protein